MSENVITEALVNRKTGEVVEIGLQKTPDEIMVDASEAAKALERVISSNKRKLVEFNGKRFLEFPHWQTIGRFFHTTVATDEAEFVTLQGNGEAVRGFKATAKVIDEKTGAVVGNAEAYCMTDEPNWKHKPLFQLASMAQTRAASKALSNKYRYVAILAGYEPTPGEEVDMTSERGLRAPKERPAAIAPAPEPPELSEPVGDAVEEIGVSGAEIEFGDAPPDLPEPTPGEPLVTDKQRKMLFARCRAAGISEGVVKEHLLANYNIEHSRDLTRRQFDEMLKWIETAKGAAV